ncbi:MAG: hypothetical protein HC811_14090 [Flammeovirgaceae bacterium]|nr:hypothetical protein [Flammeovirgaceae bacterium]
MKQSNAWAALKKDGPIVCLDADCTVSPDYLIKASQAFADHSVNVAHFKFQHDLSLQADDNLRAGIVAYELHLRCYVQGLKKAGYFFAIHTIGSCMAVRSSSYARAGGMNKKTAGEDFYFLHKLIPHGGWKYIDAMVYPSSRISDRVPFGTGRAQLEWLENSTGGFTYNIEVYKVMEALFKATKKWFLNEIILDEFHPILQRFLTKVNARQRISELRRQSTSLETFEKRCRQWMDGFWVLKLTHYLRDNGFPNQPVELVAKSILNINSESREELLNQLRSIDYLEP